MDRLGGGDFGRVWPQSDGGAGHVHTDRRSNRVAAMSARGWFPARQLLSGGDGKAAIWVAAARRLQCAPIANVHAYFTQERRTLPL